MVCVLTNLWGLVATQPSFWTFSCFWTPWSVLSAGRQSCAKCTERSQARWFYLIATPAALLLSIICGRTDLCISGVFSGGKTRAGAAVIGGLLVMDPELTIMVMTKEMLLLKPLRSIFRHGLPNEIYERTGGTGRLAGYMESFIRGLLAKLSWMWSPPNAMM